LGIGLSNVCVRDKPEMEPVMDSYKHSCPFCGQHVEYTVEYCGKQMICPFCGKLMTFPAIPPGGKRPLRLKRAEVVQRRKWSFNLKDIMIFLREFEHWNIVWAGVVPFVIIAGLLVGAVVLKKNAGEGPAMPAIAPVVGTNPNRWQQMTNQARMEEVMQERLAAVKQSQAAVKAAQQTFNSINARYQGRALDQYAVQNQVKEVSAANKILTRAQSTFEMERSSFEAAFLEYQKMGGKMDYRSQLP
jgi:hypothetical protein